MAFDTLDRDFLFKSLRSYAFGDKLISWVRLMYTDAEASILNNGHSSGWFSLDTGLRQGCPASPHLFLLAVEKLAHVLRSVESIKGADLGLGEYKLSQYADDLTLFVRDGQSLENALLQIQEFGLHSNLRLNVQKSIGLKIGLQPELGQEGSQLVWSDSANILGLNFYAFREDTNCTLTDFQKYVSKMTDICNKWSKRKVALKAKVTVLNTLVFPILYYAAQNSHCPPVVLEQVKRLTVKFLWNGNRPIVSMATLYQPIERGGLGLHNFGLRVKAAHVAWAKRFIQATHEDFWIDFFCQSCRVTEPVDVLTRRQRVISPNIPPFNRSILIAWNAYYAVSPNSDLSVRAEPLWFNRFIKWGALRRFQTIWSDKGIARINDLIFEGKLMSRQLLSDRYGINLTLGQSYSTRVTSIS